MQEVQLFDVDGTLTFNKSDAAENLPHYDTHAYWPLLTKRCCHNPVTLQKAIDEWEASMTKTPDHLKDQSSFTMMDKTLRTHLRANVNAMTLQQEAKKITADFHKAGVLQIDAIMYLDQCLQKNITCALTTGSYLDGLIGMVQYLLENKLIHSKKAMLLNGAVVDWETRTLTRANVGHYKTENLMTTLDEKAIKTPWFSRAFGDDPLINDSGILALPYTCIPPGQSFVIKAQRNIDLVFDERYQHKNWADITAMAPK